jgi:hypothetical protein
MTADIGLGVVVLCVLTAGYLLPAIIVTLRGCRRTGLYWILNIALGWSVCVWAYLMCRAVFIDHENDV